MHPWGAGGGPSDDEIRSLVSEGMTQKAIADTYGVARQTVAYWMRRAGIPPQPRGMTHKDFLPWSIKNTDHHDSIARALRWYSTLQQGGDLDPVARREVERLLEFLKAEKCVVDYDRERGFILRRRKPGVDKATDIIRRPR